MFTARNIAESGEVAQNVWLLVLGVLSFVVIMSVLVMFSIFLAREILEVRRQDSFIDSVTHELKTPLASIKLCLQTLDREGLADDKRETLRRMMHHDVDRLSTFIDDVLQASRLAHGDVDMNHTPVNLASLISESATSLRTRHDLATEAIVVDVPDELVVHSDRAALEVVTRNLLDNAIKYSPKPVKVEVRASVDKDGRHVWIDVRDHGIGIAPDDVKRIFQRFYRAPGEDVRSRKGTGLGLFVVSALLRNLGGTVDAVSEGPGKGSTFRVRLPVAPASTTTVATQRVPA